mgnify:CR=1 FL=1
MYMSANFQVISDPVVFQNAQVTIYRAQKVVTMNADDRGQNVLPLPAALLSQSVILSIWRLILKRMLLLIRSMIRLSTMLFIPVLSKPYARSAKRPV